MSLPALTKLVSCGVLLASVVFAGWRCRQKSFSALDTGLLITGFLLLLVALFLLSVFLVDRKLSAAGLFAGFVKKQISFNFRHDGTSRSARIVNERAESSGAYIRLKGSAPERKSILVLTAAIQDVVR